MEQPPKKEILTEEQRVEKTAAYESEVEKAGQAEVSFPEYEARQRNLELLEKARRESDERKARAKEQELAMKLNQEKTGNVIDGKFGGSKKEAEG